MKKVVFNTNAFLLASILSFVLMFINIITLNWYPLTWTDEVMWVDPAVNVIQNGVWTSTIWDYIRSPLYTLILIPWMEVFGISHIAVCSFSVLIAFVANILILYILAERKLVNSLFSSILFVLIFWCASSFSWTIRSGRIDMIVLLFTILSVKEILNFNSSFKSSVLLVLYSCGLIWSGIYSPPLVVIFLLFLFITCKAERHIFQKKILFFFLGSFIGFIGVSLFFFFHKLMFHFWISPFSVGSTSKSSLFFEVIDAYYVRNQYIDTKEVLLLILITIVTFIMYRKQIIKDKLLYLCIIFSILVPLFMTLLSRYRVYYSWLCFLPLLVCYIILINKYHSQLNKWLAIILASCIVGIGLPLKLYQSDKTASNRVEYFIKKQKFAEGSKILSGYLPYYALKNEKCDVYVETEKSGPPTFKKLSTIIKNETLAGYITGTLLKYEKWGNENMVSDKYDYYIFVDHDWEYNKNEIKERVYKYLKTTDSRLEMLDKLDSPSITIYKIIKN